MEYRRLLRPLPLFLIVLFVAVAVADFIQTVTEEPPPLPTFAGKTVPRFASIEPLIDFRAGGQDSTVDIQPIPELAPGQWSGLKPQGVWTRGAVADLRLELVAGGHRELILECQPATGKRPVDTLRLTVNGIDLGAIDITAGWHQYRVALPEGAVHPGSNRIVFRFPNRDPTAKPWRSLLIRKLGLFFDEKAGLEALDGGGPVSVDLDAERVTIRRSGILEIPVVLDSRTDALQMRYRFSSGTGRVEVLVAQMEVGSPGLDNATTAVLKSDEDGSGRVRVPLHGRRGAYAVRISADLGSPDSQLLISSLRLVEEGDPSRRPWAVNSPPD